MASQEGTSAETVSSLARSAPGSALFLAVMFVGYAAYAADRSVLSSMLKPLSTVLDLTDLQKGLLSSAQYVGVLAFVFLAGHLSDRYGTRKIIILGVSVFTAFTWLIGLSTDFYQAFFFRLVSGFGEGIFWPVAMAAVANYFRMRKGLALGIFYVGFDAGMATGLTVGGTAFALTSDWRYAFFVAPLLGIAVVAGVFAARGAFASADGRVGRIALGRDALELLKGRRTQVLMLFAFLATWASVWQVVFLPYYYSAVLGLSIPLAAFLASAVAISGGLGKVILGGASDSWRRDRMLVAISAVVVILYAGFFSAPNVFVSAVMGLAMGFFSSSIFPVMQALMADSCDGNTGTALGLTTTAQSAATVLAPVITAYRFSFGVGGSLALNALVPAVAMLAVAVVLREPRIEPPRQGTRGTMEAPNPK
ncbi:MAG: MFS transporter [Thaumarchaeota archaeon]|nr:MFS transporter [Nitrososphaerota archaeon]